MKSVHELPIKFDSFYLRVKLLYYLKSLINPVNLVCAIFLIVSIQNVFAENVSGDSKFTKQSEPQSIHIFNTKGDSEFDTTKVIVTATYQCYNDSFGNSTGYGQATATGGTPPYNYKWSNGNTGAYISSLANGTYTVTVTDENGATKTTSINVSCTNQSTLKVTATSHCDTIGNSGYGQATATGGTPPYNYKWSNGNTGAYISSLANGTYTVTVTDKNGATIL